jgi:hypothetical protein
MSTDGNCPRCKSTNWKTLEALALTQRTRSESTTTGVRRQQRRETKGSTTTEAAAQHAPPARPADYHLLDIYRKGCSGNVAAAKQRLAEIDAASRQPKEMLPGLLRSGPESYESSFERNAGKLTALLEYDADLARWKATRICMRCAATFIDSRASVPTPPAMVFRFAGQERRCPHCQSYFWKDPAAVADGREAQAEEALARAKKQLRTAEETAANAAATPPPTGVLKRLAAFLTPAPISPEEARTALKHAEMSYRRAVLGIRDLRAQFDGHSDMRWCAGCQAVYPAVFATAEPC